MSPVPHAKLVREILDREHIVSLSDETDKRQLEVYGLVLSQIRDTIEMHLLIDIPHETVVDGLAVMDELARVLVPMSLREIEEVYQIKRTILPLAESAVSSATQAVRIYEKEKKKARKGIVQKEDLPQEYTDHVIRFRRHIIEVHEHLRVE